jgi:sugar lactone lactonase YvrE
MGTSTSRRPRLDGHLYVAGRVYDTATDTFGPGRIVRIDGASGARIDEFGTDALRRPVDLVFGPDGLMYVADAEVGIVRFDPATGAVLDTVVANGTGGLAGASGLAFGPDGNLHVGSSGNHTVLCFAVVTEPPPVVFPFLDTFVSSGSGGLSEPDGIAFAPDGFLLVCSRGTRSVLRYSGTTGAFVDVLVGPTGDTTEVPAALTFTPRPPRLEIQPEGPSLRLIWPVFTKRFRLQFADALSADPAWASNSAPEAIEGTNLVVTVPAPDSDRFFRLKAD